MAKGFVKPSRDVPPAADAPAASTPEATPFKRQTLTVELVPSTCWYVNVRSEVSKTAWEKLRSRTSLLAGHRCEVCGGRGRKWPVECHEIWSFITPSSSSETARNSPNEGRVQRLMGLQALCSDCHLVKHIGRAQATGQGERAFKHLAKVNGWSLADAQVYVEVAHEEWSRRSAHEWTLDISWLDDFLST